MSDIFSGVYFQDKADHSKITGTIEQAISEKAKSLIVLISCQSDVCLSAIPELAQHYQIPIYACIVPGVIYQKQYSYHGVLVVGFMQGVEGAIIENLDDEPEKIESTLQKFIDKNGYFGSAFVFIDGLSDNVEPFITSLYEQLGNDRRIIGAGAGNIDFQPAPCIADEHGCYRNAALIVSISNQIKLQTIGKHGFSEVAGPFLITRADNNVVKSLNYQPAFDVYQKTIKTFKDVDINEHNFSEIAHSFPFGLKQLDSDFLVRDTVRLEEKRLVCVGNVAENSLVYILNSNKEQLIDAAALATKEIAPKLNLATSANANYIMVVDCISRSLFLNDDYQQEVNAINDNLPDDIFPAGVPSLGEIKNTTQGAVQFLNKTLVLGGF